MQDWEKNEERHQKQAWEEEQKQEVERKSIAFHSLDCHKY